jgi:ComF family protein
VSGVSALARRTLDPLRRSAEALLAFTYPQRCPGCGAEVDPRRFLCDPCRDAIPRLSIPLCIACLLADREPVGCAKHQGFSVRAPWLYDPRIEPMVHALKYHDRRDLAETLGEEMVAALPPGYRPELVLAVPLHPARLRERGYNQAAWLADRVAERIGAPRLDGVLERRRATRPQAKLGPRARRDNLALAFSLAAPRAVEGREVLIVDDVLTTGATLAAALAPLRDVGARASGLTVAWAQ